MILLSMILPKNSSVKKDGRIIYSRIIFEELDLGCLAAQVFNHSVKKMILSKLASMPTIQERLLTAPSG
jgi:hypothetical protein